MTKRAAVTTVITLSILGALWYVLAPKTDSCVSDKNIRWCFIEKTRVIAETKGVPEALAFVKNTVAPNTNYGTVHLSLHYVGYQAYKDAGNLKDALAYIPSDSMTQEDFLFYNGIQHGIFERYLEIHGNSVSTATLSKEACGDYASIANLDSEPSEATRIAAAECYHSLGHALMFANENDIGKSLLKCDTFAYPWMKEWCYHGVFMENYYLYIPGYSHGITEPSAQEPSILAMCKSLNQKYQPQCDMFVSWVYLYTHPEDFAGAFAECATLGHESARICVARAGRFYVPSHSKGDFKDMVAVCAQAGAFEEECLEGSAIGLNEGTASFSTKGTGQLFCDSLEEKYRAGCTSAVARSYESLARIYVTVL